MVTLKIIFSRRGEFETLGHASTSGGVSRGIFDVDVGDGPDDFKTERDARLQILVDYLQCSYRVWKILRKKKKG